MSSSGSSISSQSSEDARRRQPATRHGGSSLGRIKSEHGTLSSREPRYERSNHSEIGQPGGIDARTRPTASNSSSRTMSAHGQFSVPTLSSRAGVEPSTWSEFLRDSASLSTRIDLAKDAEHMSSLAADRKRRLTASAQDSGRRRSIHGGYHNRQLSGQPHQLDGPSSPQRSAWPRRTDSIDRSQMNYIDLTTSPPLALGEVAQTNSARPSVSSVRQYVIPKWQPDSEASQCPICKRQFSLLFRRHHCRKCGRVVCNDCSPHRITIPRQFIVHPPDPSGPTQSRANSIRAPPETIDLTEDAERVERPTWARSTTAGSNPALGGGEKVRLCNPCVPDPQPNPHLDPGISRLGVSGQVGWPASSAHELPSEGSGGIAVPQVADAYQIPFSEQGSEPRRQTGRHIMMQDELENPNTVQTNIAATPYSRASPYVGLDNSTMLNFSRRERPSNYRSYPNVAVAPPRYHVSSAAPPRNAIPGVHPSGSAEPVTGFFPPHPQQSAAMQLPLHGHARYQSLDTAPRPIPSAGGRPRVRSMLDTDSSLQRFLDQATASGSSRSPAESRPRLHERDICPICRHALPQRGADGDETAREAHIMDCIAGRDPASAHSSSTRHGSGGQLPPHSAVHMLAFVASEKDCVGEDGNVQECTICMVEYDVGDQLARLECLCKFHKACIVEWFGRKQECPVHKIA